MKKVLFWTLYPFYVIAIIVLWTFYAVGHNCEKLMDFLYDKFYKFYSLID